MSSYDIIQLADYLSIKVEKSLDFATFKKITDEVLQLCRENDIRKVVIDVTDTVGTFTDADKVRFADYASGLLKDVIDKYAYVYPHEHLDYSSQVVSQGRGFNVRAYYDLEDAINWLEQD